MFSREARRSNHPVPQHKEYRWRQSKPNGKLHHSL